MATGRILALALTALVVSQAAFAQNSNFSAGAVVPACRAFLAAESSPNAALALREGLCIGIVATVYADGSIYNDANRFCVSNNSSIKDAVRIVVAFFDEHPGLQKEDLRDVAIVALKKFGFVRDDRKRGIEVGKATTTHLMDQRNHEMPGAAFVLGSGKFARCRGLVVLKT